MTHIYWLSQKEITFFLNNNPSAKAYYNSIDAQTLAIKYPSGYQFLGRKQFKSEKYTKKMIQALSLPQAIPNQPQTWKCILTINVEENMPFTLGDVVFWPQSYLESASLPDLQYTLLHEWIHILQRQHPILFNNLATHILGFRQIKLTWSEKILQKPIFYVNPDGEQNLSSAWVYDVFMPSMLFHKNKKTFQKSYFLIEDGEDPSVGNIVEVVRKCPSSVYADDFQECSPHHLYHPYEIQADTGAKYLIDGKTKNPRLDGWWNSFFLRQKQLV